MRMEVQDEQLAQVKEDNIVLRSQVIKTPKKPQRYKGGSGFWELLTPSLIFAGQLETRNNAKQETFTTVICPIVTPEFNTWSLIIGEEPTGNCGSKGFAKAQRERGKV